MSSVSESTPADRRRILFASLIGTTIEFFDFYIYATAAVLVASWTGIPQSGLVALLLCTAVTLVATGCGGGGHEAALAAFGVQN